MAVSGAGAATTRDADVNWLLALRKKTLTGTSDVGFGSVVVVVGRWGSSSLKGTFDAAMVLGAPCVGMAQPAATTAPSARTSASAAARRLTRPLPARPRRPAPAG